MQITFYSLCLFSSRYPHPRSRVSGKGPAFGMAGFNIGGSHCFPFLISRVRPVHSFFEKKSILENSPQIFTNLFFNAYLIVVNPDLACCFCLKNGLFFNRFSKFTKTVKKEADIFTKMRGRLSDECGCVVQNTSIV